MLKQTALASLALLASTVVTGCADEQPQTAEATLQVLLERLYTDQDPGVAWDLLPASYRKDLQGYCRRLGEALPGAAYDKFFQVLRKTGVALKANGESIPPMVRGFRSRMMGAGLSAIFSGADDKMTDSLEAVGNVLILVGRCELGTKQGLARCDLGAFLHDAGRRIWTHGSRAFELTGKELGDLVPDFETVTADEKQATIRFGKDKETWEMQFVRVDGAWVPDFVASGWPTLRAEFDTLLAELAKDETKKFLAQAEQTLDTILADLELLQEPVSRTKFGNLVQKIGMRWAKELSGFGGEAIGDMLELLKPK